MGCGPAALPFLTSMNRKRVSPGLLAMTHSNDAARSGDILLRFSDDLKDESYIVNIVATASMEGGNYEAVALGTATLLQLLGRNGSDVTSPRLRIEHQPRAAATNRILSRIRRRRKTGRLLCGRSPLL